MNIKLKIAIGKVIIEILFLMLFIALLIKYIDNENYKQNKILMSVQSNYFHIQAKEYEIQSKFIDSYVSLKMSLHSEQLGDNDPKKIQILKQEIFEMKILRGIKND